jgi:hypothetical protein
MKKIILIASITAISIVALFINVSLNRNSQTGDIKLAQLTVINVADAECQQGNGGGGCSFGGNCFWYAGGPVCDPTKPS